MPVSNWESFKPRILFIIIIIIIIIDLITHLSIYLLRNLHLSQIVGGNNLSRVKEIHPIL